MNILVTVHHHGRNSGNIPGNFKTSSAGYRYGMWATMPILVQKPLSSTALYSGQFDRTILTIWLSKIILGSARLLYHRGMVRRVKT